MHPFYEQNRRFLEGIKKPPDNGEDRWIGIASMAMYLVFWSVALAAASRMARKYFLDSAPAREKMDPAISIARKRYARGKINAKEFRKIKSRLG